MSDPSTLEDLLTAHRQRLDVLLHTQARMGIETPAHVTVEIHEIRRLLERAKAVIGSPLATALDAATPGQRTAVITNAVSVGVDRISSAVTTRMDFLDERIDTLQYIIVAMIVVHLLSIITITVLVVDMAYGSRLGGSVWNATQSLAVSWRSHWLWLLRWAW